MRRGRSLVLPTLALDVMATEVGLDPWRRDERLLESGKAFVVAQYVKL